jgi:predicted HAD superfamily Cof-like phosphohydrolase
MPNIVVEGHDGTGKSTLVAYLSRRYSRPIQHSEGPPKYPGEMHERVTKYLRYTNTLFDRHPCVSQPIYGTLRTHNQDIEPTLLKQFYDQDNIFIYCDPTKHFRDTHIKKEYEDPEHVKAVEDNYHGLLSLYRAWAVGHADFIYRIPVGEDFFPVIRCLHITAYLDRLLGYSVDPFADIIDFHEKFQLIYSGKPRRLPDDLSEFRIKFLKEELQEYIRAVDLDDFPDQLDALVDLAYVTLGTAYLHGFNFNEAWRRVHRANMMKIRAMRPEDSTRGNHRFDIVKPKGWTAPDLTDLVT